MVNFEQLKSEYKNNKGLKLCQRNRVIKLIDRYAPFVKKEEQEEELLDLINEFIKATEGESDQKVRNIFVSILTAKEPSEETIVIKKADRVGGGVQVVEKAYWGRKRVFETSEFIDKCNKKILKVTKVKKVKN